jgi:VWFA-related protein
MRGSLRILGLLPFIFTFLNMTYAQEVAASRSSATPQIHLDVVVTPKSGAPVGGLQQQDFSILDNKSAQTITSFRAFSANQEPLEVILVIDAVNSSYAGIAYQRTQISRFLKANGGHLAYPTTMVIFTDTGTQMQEDSSTDGNAMDRALEGYVVGLRSITRSTGIYGADERFQLSMKALEGVASRESSKPGRKLILWVSPGWPILSGPGIQLDTKMQQGLFATIVSLSTQLRQERITLYAINPLGAEEGIGRTNYYAGFVKGVKSPGQVNIGDLSLQTLAVQTGGLVLSSSDVAGLLEKSIADGEAYYELSFAAALAEKPNEYHALQVKVAKPGLEARTRTGYYAQP